MHAESPRLDAFPQIGVSNSEAGSASTCMRQWWYAHHPATHLAPKSLGPALTRGLLGHKALELFYLDIKAEVDYDTAAQHALDFVFEESRKAMLMADDAKLNILVRLKKILENYFEHYKSDIEHWEILDVEAFHLLEWEGENRVYLPMRIDLVIYQRGGKFKGETSPVDHKFVNDFWNNWKARLNSQLPLYIRALRTTRYKGKPAPVVRRSIVNQLRTREIANPYPHDLFKRMFIEADDNVMETVFENHLKVARKVAELKVMDPADAFQKTTAVWGSANCQFCNFKSVCATQLEGGNVDSTIDAEYQQSDYGYPTMQELKNER